MRQTTKTFDRVLDDLSNLLEPFRHNLPPTQSLPADVEAALFYIHKNLFSSECSVQQLRRQCRIRDNNFSCRFRSNLGRSIRAYIEGLRMEAAACILTREPMVRVYDVAYAVGYESIQTFYRAFSRHFLCTPTDYRLRTEANEAAGDVTRHQGDSDGN